MILIQSLYGWGTRNSDYYRCDERKIYYTSYNANGEFLNRLLAKMEGKGRFNYAETPKIKDYINIDSFGIND